MISALRVAFKILLSLLSIFLFISALLFSKLFCLFSSARAQAQAARLSHIFGKAIAAILGIKISLSEEVGLAKNRGVLFACNHLSYIDGIIATAVLPLLFIAKTDLKRWPLFGTFALLSNTIFINRSSAVDIHEELKKVTQALKNEVNVILFPEGTSSDGKGLLPFKTSFFAAALENKRPVVPLAIKYKRINSSALSEENKNFVYWYGDMYLVPHLARLCALKTIEVEVEICPPVFPVEMNAAQARKYLAEETRKEIEHALITTPESSP